MSTQRTHQLTGFVTGATGYIGGQLVQRLLAEGWELTVLTRSAEKLADVDWASRVKVVEGDASDPEVLSEAMSGVGVAWYLLHSMGESSGEDFVEQERSMAETFGRVARERGVHRLVYLGGLHPEGEELSAHLASRVAVGEALMASGVPTSVLQAGVVLGDGSASFQMLRHLSERLPGAIAPKWVKHKIQPIAIEDALHFLVGAAQLPPEINRTFDIGGPDVLSYAEMMARYASALGLGPRLVLTAPVTTPDLAARWIGLVTPISAKLAAPLIGSLLHDTVVGERDLEELVGPPPGGAIGFDDAVRRAARGSDPWRFPRTLAVTTAATGVCLVLGALTSDPGSTWYRGLRKPGWQPPRIAFPIVWPILYADIAAISALTHADLMETGRKDRAKSYAAALGLNLVLNAGWSAIFFQGHRLGSTKKVTLAASLWAAALAASSIDLTRRTWQESPQKGAVLSPYAAWTTFATALSSRIAGLNRRR